MFTRNHLIVSRIYLQWVACGKDLKLELAKKSGLKSAVFLNFGIFPKTHNSQNATDPKIPNQFLNLNMLLIPNTQRVNLSH